MGPGAGGVPVGRIAHGLWKRPRSLSPSGPAPSVPWPKAGYSLCLALGATATFSPLAESGAGLSSGLYGAPREKAGLWTSV
jgi:hypothetical protein